jgi:hypothetical protein
MRLAGGSRQSSNLFRLNPSRVNPSRSRELHRTTTPSSFPPAVPSNDQSDTQARIPASENIAVCLRSSLSHRPCLEVRKRAVSDIHYLGTNLDHTAADFCTLSFSDHLICASPGTIVSCSLSYLSEETDSVTMRATKHGASTADASLASILTLGGSVGKIRGNNTRVMSTCAVSLCALTA